MSEATPCTWQPWLARTAPGPPQEPLVRDETRRSLPTNPSLTRTTLGQLCVALMAQLALQYSAVNHCACSHIFQHVFYKRIDLELDKLGFFGKDMCRMLPSTAWPLLQIKTPNLQPNFDQNLPERLLLARCPFSKLYGGCSIKQKAET